MQPNELEPLYASSSDAVLFQSTHLTEETPLQSFALKLELAVCKTLAEPGADAEQGLSCVPASSVVKHHRLSIEQHHQPHCWPAQRGEFK